MTAVSQSEEGAVPKERSEALPNGTALLGDQFTIDRALSNGGFGITYLAKDNYLERDVVIKECYPEVFCMRQGKDVLVRSDQHAEKYRTIVQMFMREARSIAKMRHPNIVGVHRIFEDNKTAYMVLDLIHGRDLLSIINDANDPLPPAQIKETLIKILDAVDLVHQNDLLHRDISPDNILLDKWGSPFLIDFGAAREEASRETRAVSSVLIVKDGYSPQEFYFAGGKQGPSSDLYALGATFYHLISGTAPPNSQTRMAEFAGNNPDPCEPLAGRFPDYDQAFLAAIDKAMQILPKARLQSASEWLNIINKEGKRVQELKVSSRFKLEKTLTRLVSETNEYVLNSQPRDPKEAAAQSQPVQTTATKPPGWVEEFNKETSETVEEQRAVKNTVAELQTRKAERQAEHLAAQELAAWKKKNWWRIGFLKKSPPT
ncbi:serine/threonine protein kinase [Yoonia maricola]|uniref:Serine/threonine protein kinase n=1 Tax=Yoonia maricola TaxID=420999 RepID=A0A2M8W4K0_9RHOB|nr:serine/threonine-protein kinase [Yoonia maricola]PJI85838.1 serine/threonine protein kinase [Yoonia maricola]